MSVTIYTRQTCFYCVRAKALLNQLGASFNEIPVDADRDQYAAMQKASGRTSVPQIWIDDTHVGGCDELYALHRAGKLQAMLDGPAAT